MSQALDGELRFVVRRLLRPEMPFRVLFEGVLQITDDYIG